MVQGQVARLFEATILERVPPTADFEIEDDTAGIDWPEEDELRRLSSEERLLVRLMRKLSQGDWQELVAAVTRRSWDPSCGYASC